MTDQPPGPPTGSYPPPGGNYPPPSGGGGFPGGSYPPPPPGGVIGVLPQGAYTPWISRFLAFLIDYIPYLIIVGIGWGILIGSPECVDFSDTELGEILGASYESCGPSTLGQTSMSLSILIGFAYVLWNYGYRQGTTGSSVGKAILKFKVVSERTGLPIGFGLSIVRQLAHFVDAIIFGIGFLFPLWDSKRQTLADKIMTTVCLPNLNQSEPPILAMAPNDKEL